MEELAARLLNLNDNEEMEFKVVDGSLEIGVGAKRINEFDSDLIIFGAYGGGFNCVYWSDEFTDVQSIVDFLKKNYEGCELSL